jgi:protein TonB
MRGILEFTGFTGLALALHVVALQGLPEGSESAGSGGDAFVTVAATSGSLSQMVAQWEKSPVAETSVPAALPQMSNPPSLEPAIAAPDRIAAPLPRPALPSALAIPEPERRLPPEVTIAAPPLPVPDRAPPKVRPPERPDRQVQAAKPADTPKTNPQTERTAAGQGAASARGTDGKAASASLSNSARQSLLAEWGASIRSRIDKAKPRGSGRGTVTVVLRIGPDGGLQSVSVAQSSGQAALDQRAVQTVRSAGRLPRAPAGLTEGSYTFRLPIKFN